MWQSRWGGETWSLVEVIYVTVNNYIELSKLKFHYLPSADTSDICTKLLTDTNSRSQNWGTCSQSINVKTVGQSNYWRSCSMIIRAHRNGQGLPSIARWSHWIRLSLYLFTFSLSPPIWEDFFDIGQIQVSTLVHVDRRQIPVSTLAIYKADTSFDSGYRTVIGRLPKW